MPASPQLSVAKVLIMGEPGVGKTSLVLQYATKKFSADTKETSIADFFTADVTVAEKRKLVQVWDTPGREKWHERTGTSFYKGIEGCLLVFSMDDLNSFKRLEFWRTFFLAHAGISSTAQRKFPFVVIGNKVDEKDIKVNKKEVEAWCKEKNIALFYASAKTNKNVSISIETLVHQIIDKDFVYTKSKKTKEQQKGDPMSSWYWSVFQVTTVVLLGIYLYYIQKKQGIKKKKKKVKGLYILKEASGIIRAMQQSHLWDKVTVVIIMALFSSVYSGLSLFKPQILTSIIRHEHPLWSDDQVDSKASFYKSFLDGTSCVVSLFMLPILGGLSDIFGRKKIMIVGSVALAITPVIYKFAYSYSLLWVLYLSCAVSFQMATQVSTIAYMSDIAADEKEKSSNFGYVLAAFMTGIIAGSMCMGILGKKGIDLPLYVLFGVSVILILIEMLAFHEDSPFYKERIHRKFDARKSNPFSAMQIILGTNTFVTMMAIVYAINYLVKTNGVLGSVAGLSSVLWQALGVGILLKYFSRMGILAATFFVAVGVHATQGFSPVGWIFDFNQLFMTGAAVSGFGAIGFPLMQSLISEQIPTGQQGIAFGGLSALSSVASLIGSLITENTLAYCLTKKFVTCPGTAFYICAFLFFVNGIICVVLYLKYPQKVKEERRREEYVTINASEERVVESS